MVKRGVFLISIIFILLLQISLATSVSYTYTTVSDQVNAVVYKISDNSLVNTYNSGSTNKIIINYDSTDPKSIYNTYHYKMGFLPYLKTANSDYVTGFITKQSNCQTPISSVSMPDSATQDQEFTITVNLGSINNVFIGLTIPSFIPNELTEYYKADTDVKLYIDDQLKETKSIKISTTGNNLQFTPSILTTGSHNIKIVTEVTDNQCSNDIPAENIDSITINPSQQPPTCTDDCTIGQKQCSNNTAYKTCGSYDSDTCLDWSTTLTSCSSNKICSNDQCITQQTTCNESWSCTPWGTGCGDNNLQTRTCTDQNSCGTSSTKPATIQSCSAPQTQQNQSTVTQTCVPNPICGDWSECDNQLQTRTCRDQSHCGLDEYQESRKCNDSESQAVSITTKEQSEAELNARMNKTVNEMLSRISDGIQQLIVSNKYYFIVSFAIILLIVVMILAYIGAHKEKILKPRTKVLKSDKKSVKINDLMLSVIDSLDADERELCYLLVENEGITQEELLKKTSLTKTKLEIALTKLERRQVIKKREEDNSKIFFNDWLK